MNYLAGKRLLCLGGSMWKEAISQFAEEQNITLIATGNDTSAGIFSIADETYSVNSIDNDSMKRLICDKRIDGVYMGGSETVISHACEYINELGMPCYCTKEQWDKLQNKSYFKSLCIKHSLPVVSRYAISSADIETKGRMLPFPVITKPADGCGSSGFSVCHTFEEFKVGFMKASANSFSGEVMVEDFVKNDGIVVFYTLSQGKIYFSGIEDKYPVKYTKQGSYVAGNLIFESHCTEDFRKKFESKLQDMVSDIGLKEGSFWIEVFYDGENYYFNEAGYRYGGTVSVYPVDYLYGYNQVAADIHYALTGSSTISGFTSMINPKIPRNKKYGIYAIHLHPGIIDTICGINDVLSMTNIVAFPRAMNEGHEVTDTGTISQVFGFLHFVFDTADEWSITIKSAISKLKILDRDKHNLINTMIDLDDISLISRSL